MPTPNLKKYLNTLTKEELIKHILELDKKFKPVQEYFSCMSIMYLKALKYLNSAGLLSAFESLARDIVDKTVDIDWGFHDTLGDCFYQYYR